MILLSIAIKWIKFNTVLPKEKSTVKCLRNENCRDFICIWCMYIVGLKHKTEISLYEYKYFIHIQRI